MKSILLLFMVLGTFSCKALPDPDSITPKDLYEIVNYLASDSLKGRVTGSEGIDTAANYIEDYFKTLGVKPYFETYRDTFKTQDIEAFNVVGVLEGSDSVLKNEVIILSAHYDHIGVGKSIKKFGGRLTDIDSIANGANDNASGTATVLALAKHFSNIKNNKRTIMFVLFAGEEFGVLGSKHLSERLKSEHLNLYTMINLEMLGVPFTDHRGYDVFLSGYDLSNMAKKINEYTRSNLIGKSDVAAKFQLFKRSDNYPFYTTFNVPCQTISSCDLSNYDFYHHVDDEADKLDYEHMTKVANKLIPAIEAIANSDIKEIKMNDE
ncbi:M28 family peptidase [Flavobacteriaceae bacterium LMO-SS05]